MTRFERAAQLKIMALCEPFARVANIVDALPQRRFDDESLRNVMPGAWPTVGDVRKLRDEMEHLGWKTK